MRRARRSVTSPISSSRGATRRAVSVDGEGGRTQVGGPVRKTTEQLLQRLRPFTHGDIEALVRLLGRTGGWPTHEAPSPSELIVRWTRRGIEPTATYRVLPAPDGEFIAYFHASPFGDRTSRLNFEAAVLPEWRGQGIGSRFYAFAEQEARRLGHTHMASSVYVLTGDGNPAGTAFLQRRGFKRQSAYWQFRLDDLRRQPQPHLPPGFSLVPYLDVPEAPARWTEIIVEAFNEQATPEAIDAQTREPGSDPRGYFFALEDATGRLVGTTRARLDPSPTSPGGTIGYIGTVGILPAYRRRGIAQALMLQTLGYLRNEGVDSAVLFVEDRNHSAQELYRGMGWYPVYRSDNYWKTLEPGTSAPTRPDDH
jgi:mycothiol synthase